MIDPLQLASTFLVLVFATGLFAATLSFNQRQLIRQPVLSATQVAIPPT